MSMFSLAIIPSLMKYVSVWYIYRGQFLELNDNSAKSSFSRQYIGSWLEWCRTYPVDLNTMLPNSLS